MNFILTIFLARSLGPEKFGILNYLLAFTFLFTSISSLGINPVLVNKIIKNKNTNNHSTIVNAYYARFTFSLLNYFFFIIIISLFNSNRIYQEYSLIIGLTIIFKSSEVFFSYFEAKSLSKFVVISQLIGLAFSTLIILYILFNNYNFIYILYALSLDALIVFIIINSLYFNVFKFFFVKLNLLILKKIIVKSLPVLISTISIILYMRTDQIMIKNMLDEYNLGIYSVSVRYVEIYHFIPKIIMISFLPILLTSRDYDKKLLRLNSLLIKLSLALVFAIFFSSEFLIEFIFGENYSSSTITTKILSFSIIFVFIGVINEHWYISRNLQIFYAINVFIGAIINLVLNYFLILKFGINGAAYATILTYFIIIFLLDIFYKKTKELLKIKYKALIKI